MARLERDSNELPTLDVVTEVVESPKLEKMFQDIVEAVKKGTEVEADDLKLAMAAVAIPVLLQSCTKRWSFDKKFILFIDCWSDYDERHPNQYGFASAGRSSLRHRRNGGLGDLPEIERPSKATI